MFPKDDSIISVQVPFEADVITHHTTARILTAIIDHLAYHRRQIPFVYNTFKFMVDKFQRASELSDDAAPSDDLNHFHVDRERTLAFETLEQLSQMRSRILTQMESVEIEQALIVFGATSVTPKEAYLVELPAVTDNHFAKNHVASDQTIVRRINM